MSIHSRVLKSLVLLAIGSLPMAAVAKPPVAPFQQPTVLPTGNWPAAIVTADLNGDGKADLVYTDFGATATASTTHILLGNGDGTFTAGPTIPTAGTAIAVADFDGDGHPDLEWVWAVMGQGRVYFAKGNGDGTFAPATQLGTFAQIGTNTPQLSYVVGAHMHDTGYLDLLVEDTANSALFELTADSSGVLVRLIGMQLPDGTGPMATADLNGDGHTDLVIQGQRTGTVDVMLGSVDGILQPPTRLAGATGIQSMLLHDLDGDGHPDLLLEGANGHLDLYHGLPDGTFSTSPEGGSGSLDGSTGTGGHLIALTDSGQHLYTATPTGISLLQPQSDLTLKLQAIFNAGPGRTSFVVADFNGDGLPDLALDSPEGIALLFSNPDGTLQSSRAFSTGKPATSGTIGAFSGTGQLDALVSIAATQAQLLHGNGDGTFTSLPSPTNTQPGNPALIGTILTGDFNGDGKLDLAITQSGSPLPTTGSGLNLQFGNGDGTFGPLTPLPGNLYGTSVAANFNVNGPASIAIANADGDHLLTMQPGGSVTTTDLATATTSALNLVAAGDLNHDGLADLIYQSGKNWTVYLNGGNNTFAQAANLPGAPTLPGFTAASIVIADLDGDGNGDVLIAFDNTAADHAHPTTSLTNALYLWYGLGDGTFSPPVVLTPSRNYNQLAAFDLDGDGLLDLVMSDGYLLNVQRNLGNRSFAPESHLLAGMGINSISSGDVNQDGSSDLILANGGTLLTNPAVHAASTSADVNTGGITVLLNALTARPVLGALTAAPSSTLVGQTFTITAHLQAITGGPTATGSVSFAIDGNPLGTAAMVAGLASITSPATIPVGLHTLTATYSGDTNYAARHFSSTHSVTELSSSVQLTITTPATVFYGQPINGSAQVNSSDGSTLTGSIIFYDGSITLCQIPVSLNASCPASTAAGFATGIHHLTAVYSGDATHTGSTSNLITVTVQPDATTATLAASINSAPLGQSVTFTASLTGNYATPSGTVTFLDGNTVLGSAQLNSTGVAIYTTAVLSTGTHAITAVYAATQNFTAATTAVLSEIVQAAPTTIATAAMLASTANPATTGQPLTLTANVVTVTASQHSPTGTVTFLDGNTILATAPLNSLGLATYTSAALAPGTHLITASYAGDGTASPSTSPTFSQVITAALQPTQASFTIHADALSVTTGQTANVTVKVSPINGFNQPVQLACTNLPSEATCLFAAATIPGGGGTTTMQLNTLAPRACGSSTPYGPVASLPLTGPMFAGLLLLFLPRRRKAIQSLLTLLIALATITTITGCGACTDLGTRPGTYTITITGTSTGSAQISTTQQVQVTVIP